MKEDPDFIEHHKVDLAASLEATVVDILMDKLRKAAKEYKIKEVAVAGGVSARPKRRTSKVLYTSGEFTYFGTPFFCLHISLFFSCLKITLY